jgi:NADPH-dependent 2,4-dienoyl-CoA reductase/sulfur reductase-like enzyme
MTAEQAGVGQHIVVVGASLAGVRAVETVRARGFAGTVTLVGGETHFPPVDRPPLSKAVLMGGPEHVPARVRVGEDLQVDLRLGRRAVELDIPGRTVSLDDGSSLTYDGLVIATGAAPRRLPGVEGPHVHVLRTVEDSERLRQALTKETSVAVIGAGVLGCEVAASCRGLGLPTSLIDIAPAPMLRVVGSELSEVFRELHASHGVQLRLGRQVLGLGGEDGARTVILDGGEEVPADVVVVAVGVAPETDWLEGSGLELRDGVVCDELCFATADHTVVAAGDVARWRHPIVGNELRVEHWTNAVSQAQVAAANLVAALTDRPADLAPYTALPYAWSDQYDWKIQTVGVPGPTMTVEEGRLDERQFVVAYRDGDRLVGAICVNWPSRVARWRSAVIADSTEAAQSGSAAS